VCAEGGVLYLDVDGKLDAARVPDALSRRIAAARAAAEAAAAAGGGGGGAAAASTARVACGAWLCAPEDEVYRASLARFRLLRCRSSAALVQAAAVLDMLVCPPAGVAGATPTAVTRLLLIDNLVRRSHAYAALPVCSFHAALTANCGTPAPAAAAPRARTTGWTSRRAPRRHRPAATASARRGRRRWTWRRCTARWRRRCAPRCAAAGWWPSPASRRSPRHPHPRRAHTPARAACQVRGRNNLRTLVRALSQCTSIL
jgi:hypothetical protein